MNRIDQAFVELIRKVTLTEGHRQQLAERTGALASVLQSQMATPQIVPIGSFTRGTLVPPGNDADVMFVWAGAPPQPREALTRLRALLAPRYASQDLRVQKHSVRIAYREGPSLDVVPARAAGTNGYEIPELVDPSNANSEMRWVVTNPEADAQRVRRANERTNGWAAKLVAALKSANAGQTTKLRSIHLERIVLDAIEAGVVYDARPAGATEQALGALRDALRGQDHRAWRYPSTVVCAEIANRYATDVNRFREALLRDDVALAATVIPLLR